MADVNAAIDITLRQEDSTLSGVITSIPGDSGGRTRYGIAERWHPELTATGFFSTMSAAAALTVAEGVYTTSYAKPLMLSQINAQGVAAALLSFAVVEGSVEAVKLLQQACGAAVDGHIGPTTIARVNGCVPAALLETWCELEKTYFQKLGAANPADQEFVAGWDNRAQADEELASA
jgi:lysozyme family protein